jgi:hypothetical protein
MRAHNWAHRGTLWILLLGVPPIAHRIAYMIVHTTYNVEVFCII